jgi:DtxR family Mn-dependent transcriptional regulator
LGRRLIRHHRLWEVFLNRTLNIPWDKVHNEAEHLEHAASDALMNRMDEYLGFPTVDPHGNPIPGLDGTIFFDDNEMVLSEICDNFLVVIHRLEGMDATVLSYLSQQGLCIGSELRIIQRFEFDKTFICEISGRSIQLSFGMAQHIYVLPSTDTMN